MTKKTIMAISLGVLVAGLLCLIAGLICYFAIEQNPLAFIIGLFMIFAGSIMAAIPLFILLAILIITLVTREKNK